MANLYRLMDRPPDIEEYRSICSAVGWEGIVNFAAANISLANSLYHVVALHDEAVFFSSAIAPDARPVAIDASRDLIRAGLHSEAVFWIVATFARCHKILAVDAPPDVQRALAPAFDDLLADLGITSPDDLLARATSAIRI